jgi:hypothetical protein
MSTGSFCKTTHQRGMRILVTGFTPRHNYRTAEVAIFAKVREMADPSREHLKPDLRKLYSIVLLAPKPPDQLLRK